MSRLLALINGEEDLGRSGWFWLVAGLVVLGFALLPLWETEFGAYNISFYLLNIPLALGLCMLWGYCGVLSFGQVAYFGIAAYIYGIVAGNMIGNNWGPLVASAAGLAACAVVGTVFGYFVFYARVQAWIVPILTLVFTLLLETFLGQTAGYQWRVGTVQLGGYNGMTAIPPFQLGSHMFMGYSFYYYALVLVLVCYLACRMLVNSPRGKTMLAIREDDLRTELLGYDIRRHQLVTFVLAAMLAGLSGLLYVQWGNYITPTQVGLLQAALPVVWVAVGGRERLLAVLIATYALNWFNYQLATQGNQYAPVYMGAMLVLVMLFAPRGIIVTVAEMVRQRRWNPRMTEVVLRSEGLEKRFGGVVAAGGVDIAVRRQELRCIIGPNGAGKSTLFSLLCGIYRPDRGRILFKDRDVTSLPAFRRVQMGLGLTFQTNRAYHALSVRQNLAIPSRLQNSTAMAEHYQYALKLFDLDPLSDAPARGLPHHKLQWLEILMVLAAGPEVLLLDEPTAGMSPDETLQTARVLQALNQKGLTIVVVEHDISFVREVAQVVTVLHQGRIFSEGSVAEITANADVRKIYLGRA